jgi:hypothetical protein
VVVLLLVIASNRQGTKPLEQQILAANEIEFIKEDSPLDGGSSAFFFRTTTRMSLERLEPCEGKLSRTVLRGA